MAKKLEDLLQPGERVVILARRSWLGSTVLAVAIVIGMSLLMWALDLVTGGRGNPFRIFVLFMFFAPFLIYAYRHQSVLLTERRLLFRYGYWKRKTEEVPIDDIFSIENLTTVDAPRGEIAIKRRKGRKLRISGVPQRATLARAIAAEAGLRLLGNDPAVTKIGTVLGASGILFGVALVIVVVAFGHSMITSFGNVPSEIAVGFFLALIIGVPLLVVVCVLLGMTVVYLIAVLVLRFTMSAEQMQQLVCTGYEPTGKTLYARFSRFSSRHAARYASWLYGQEIRCE